MPKRAAIPEAVAPVEALIAPPPPSPIIAKLRTDWRWAAISQFIWTFSDAFNLPDWDIENLEADLDGDETEVIPELLAKLLFALTYNRQINRDNAFENLRKTYLKRAPDATPLGTIEEPVEWAALGLSQKVQIIHQLCEWQMDNPARFRALLKTEDEEATWRVDPIGWDKAGNTYYLFDDNRLWVQRVPPAPPRPPKKTSMKAKRAERAIRKAKPAPKKSHKKKPTKAPSSASLSPPPPAEEEVVDGPRRRTQVAFYGNLTPTVAALKRGGSTQVTPQSSRGTRSSTRIQPGSASKTTAEARSSRTRGREHVEESPSKSRNTPLPLGTRVSRRLRDVDDEWQQIPDEWLDGEKYNSRSKGGREPGSERASGRKKTANGKGKARDSDEESELSELTDEEAHQAELKATLATKKSGNRMRAKVEPSTEVSNGTEGSLTPPPDEPNHPAKQEEAGDAKLESEETEAIEPEEEKAKSEPQDVDEDEDEKADPDADPEEEEEMDEVKLAAKKANELPEGFIEWEAVCVTLYDWRTFPEQFAKSRDPDEKALYQTLAQEVGPTIIDVLVTKEQERQKQLAVNNRKRSSRIVAKELEREEIMTRQRAQREMEERMTNQQKEELRQARELAEAAAQEKAREDRFKEREERAAAREEAAARRLIAEQEKEEAESRKGEEKKRKREARENALASGAPSANGNEPGERWELACEVCRKTGWNVDEDQDLVSCDDCGRWQHTECHDRLDASQGLPKRRWEDVDFQCQDCRRKAARKRQKLEARANGHASSPFAPQAVALSSGGQASGRQPELVPGQHHPAPQPQRPIQPQQRPSYPPPHNVPHHQHPSQYSTANSSQHADQHRSQRPQAQGQYPMQHPVPHHPAQEHYGHPHSQSQARPQASQQQGPRPSQSPSGQHSQGPVSGSPRAAPAAGTGPLSSSPQSDRPVLPSLQQVTGMSNGHRAPPHQPHVHGPVPHYTASHHGHQGAPHYPPDARMYQNPPHFQQGYHPHHPGQNGAPAMHARPPSGHYAQAPHAPHYGSAPPYAAPPPNTGYPPAPYPPNGHSAPPQPWNQHGPPRQVQTSPSGHSHPSATGSGYVQSAQSQPIPPGYAGGVVRRD